jgi:hypothetical protein
MPECMAATASVPRLCEDRFENFAGHVLQKSESIFSTKNNQLVRGTGGLQGPEYYSICPDWAGGVPDGSPHIIFVANVNFDDNGRLKVNVNRFSNDNVWNAENRHRIVVPKLTISLIIVW